jgi:hypothetical protein
MLPTLFGGRTRAIDRIAEVDWIGVNDRTDLTDSSGVTKTGIAAV